MVATKKTKTRVAFAMIIVLSLVVPVPVVAAVLVSSTDAAKDPQEGVGRQVRNKSRVMHGNVLHERTNE